MQIFKKNYQPQVSQKFQIDFSDFSLSEVKVPKYNEYIGTIYLFVNNINGKVYVGQTITKFYSRFCCHFGDTFRKVDNLPFHNALRKYGWENFSKYILWQTDGVYDKTPENKKLVKNVLDSKEIEYISKYEANNPEYGYNATIGGNYVPESAHSKEAIEKNNKTREEHHNNHMIGKTYDKHHLAVKILQYSVDKKFIKEWSCIKLAEDTLGINIVPRSITCGGYFWIYKNDNIENQLENKYQRYLKAKEENHITKSTPVYCYDLFGDLIESYNSRGEAARCLKMNSSAICAAANLAEKGNLVHDYIWVSEENLSKRFEIINTLREKSKIYKYKYKPIYQVYLNGDIIKLWDNLESIVKEYPSAKCSINKCLTGRLNVYKNCFWIYEEDYSDDEIFKRLEEFRKTKKSLVNKIINGEIPYTGIEETSSLDTTSRKQYLKEHPIVYQFTKNLKLVKKWDSYTDIEKETEYKFANISKNLRNKMKSAYGYIWKFEDEAKELNLI